MPGGGGGGGKASATKGGGKRGRGRWVVGRNGVRLRGSLSLFEVGG